MRDVFERIDSQTRSFYGFNPIFVLKNVGTWRKYFGFCVVVASIAWIVFGFDSCWSQMKPFIEYFSSIFIKNPIAELQNGIPFTELWTESRQFYGIGNHFSAPVIYGISFIYLSRYLEQVGIKKSLNFCTTTGLSLMSVGVFELTWNSFYAIFHGQWWVVTLRWKQITNILAFCTFSLIGVLILLYLYLEGFRPNFGKRSLILLLLTIGCWAFWINYPFPVSHITVQTTAGPWTNSDNYPQTYYCVDIAPGDGVAIGEPNWVQDDMVHFVNTFTKVIQTAAIMSVCMVNKE